MARVDGLSEVALERPVAAGPSRLATGAADAVGLGERPAFWYRLGAAHLRLVQAPDEDAARAVILARHPHARGQRLTLEPYRA